MNRFGASYFSGCPIPLEDFLKLCVEIGLDYVEIQAEHPYSPSEINARKIDYLKDLLSGYGLTPVLHGPIHDVNLASTKERIRSASVNITKDCIVLADALGSRDLVIHAGKCPADQVPLMLDRARECAIKSISELAPFANDLGIGIGLENKQKSCGSRHLEGGSCS
jgi:sugar phosphate isomerase/epimerase